MCDYIKKKTTHQTKQQLAQIIVEEMFFSPPLRQKKRQLPGRFNSRVIHNVFSTLTDPSLRNARNKRRPEEKCLTIQTHAAPLGKQTTVKSVCGKWEKWPNSYLEKDFGALVMFYMALRDAEWVRTSITTQHNSIYKIMKSQRRQFYI